MRGLRRLRKPRGGGRENHPEPPRSPLFEPDVGKRRSGRLRSRRRSLGRAEETRKKVETLGERLSGIEESVSGLPRPKVGCVEWLDPPFSAGHWVPEMVGLAGGEDLFAEPGQPSRRVSWEETSAASPEVLVLMPCGFDVQRTMEEVHTLAEKPGWSDIPAVKNDRVWVVDANSYFSRPAPRLVEGVEILARILHPEAFSESPNPDDALRLASAFSKS